MQFFSGFDHIPLGVDLKSLIYCLFTSSDLIHKEVYSVKSSGTPKCVTYSFKGDLLNKKE